MKAAALDCFEPHLKERRPSALEPSLATRLLTQKNVFRLLTISVFWFVVLLLLFYCDFLPYGTDNNETFSSLLHAKNMYWHGIGSTYGLTDESTSPNAAAAPFVYTHQGNFPRFYALLLYALGATSAEVQILITAMTIGTASILFAHIYMEHRVNALFAFIFCLVLTTDYIMTLQWFVNTWRVWHLFFFFSTLLLAHAFADADNSPRRTAICCLLFLNFACLFYFELIFAMFVAISSGLYLAFLLRRHPGKLLLGWAVSGLGSVVAITVLSLQIISYLGWQDFLSDLGYTFFSRTRFSDIEGYRNRITDFMREHNIVFWHNFPVRGLRTPLEMLRLFFRFTLASQTALLVLLSLLLTLSAWAAHAGANFAGPSVKAAWYSDLTTWMRKRAQPYDAAALLIPTFVLFGLVVAVSGSSYGFVDSEHYVPAGSRTQFISVCVVIASALVFLAACQSSLAFPYPKTAKVPAISLLAVGMCAAAAVLQQYGLDHVLAGATSYIAVLGPVAVFSAITAGAGMLWSISCRSDLINKRVVLAAGFLIAFSIFGYYHAWLYLPLHAPDSFAPFWTELVGKMGGHPSWKVLIIGTAFLSTVIILDAIHDESRGRIASLSRIFPYWLIGFTAYVIVCSIAAGYVFSAYQVRQTPFVIYVSAVVNAGAIYVLCCLAWDWSSQLAAGCRASNFSKAAWGAACTAFVSAVLAAIVGVWSALQAVYVSRIPPYRMAAMFHSLDKIAGSSSVVSTYATPVAIRTGRWSYLDGAFFQRGAWLDSDGYHLTTQDFRYLWFADWKSNSAYRTPEYFVCWLHLYFFTVVSPEKPKCGNLPGVGEIRNGTSLLKHKEVFRDEKYDLWSIVKLDWDYPPYLLPLHASSADTKVQAALAPRADGIGFRVEIHPHQQWAHPIVGAHYMLYVNSDDTKCDVLPRRLFQVADNPTDLLLPKKFKGCVRIGVAPFTATKTGSEYYGSTMIIEGDGAAK
jgi:hypothetical protein